MYIFYFTTREVKTFLLSVSKLIWETVRLWKSLMPPKLDTQPAIDKIKEAVDDMNQEAAKLLHQRTRDLSNDIRHLRAENEKQSEEIDKVNRLLEGKQHG